MAEGGEETYRLMKHTDDQEEEEDNDGTFNFDPSKPGATSTPQETLEMRTRFHEKSGFPDTSYQETDFGGTPTHEEIERRLNSLRDSSTKMLNMLKIDLHKIILTHEEKQKELQKVKEFIKKRYSNAKLDTLKIRFSGKKSSIRSWWWGRGEERPKFF